MGNYNKVLAIIFYHYIFTYSFGEKHVFVYFPSSWLFKNFFERFFQSIQESTALIFMFMY